MSIDRYSVSRLVIELMKNIRDTINITPGGDPGSCIIMMKVRGAGAVGTDPYSLKWRVRGIPNSARN